MVEDRNKLDTENLGGGGRLINDLMNYTRSQIHFFANCLG